MSSFGIIGASNFAAADFNVRKMVKPYYQDTYATILLDKYCNNVILILCSQNNIGKNFRNLLKKHGRQSGIKPSLVNKKSSKENCGKNIELLMVAYIGKWLSQIPCLKIQKLCPEATVSGFGLRDILFQNSPQGQRKDLNKHLSIETNAQYPCRNIFLIFTQLQEKKEIKSEKV